MMKQEDRTEFLDRITEQLNPLYELSATGIFVIEENYPLFFQVSETRFALSCSWMSDTGGFS